jgi:hypothetical protein
LAVEGAGDADGRRTGILGGIAAVLPLALGCGGAAVVSSRFEIVGAKALVPH